VRISIDISKKRGVRKNGIDIKIIGIARSLSTVWNEVSNCRLLKTVLSVMVSVGTIGQIRDSRSITDVLMGRLGEERKFMIGWGAGLMCMKDLVDASVTFQGIKKNSRRWQMHESPMNSYSLEIATSIVGNQNKFATNQFGRQSFPDGV